MEDNKDTVKVEETKVEEPIKEETTKTYTQEDLDNSFNAGRKKASHDWQKDEKYQEFIEWKKTNQSDSEKINELQNQIDTLTNEKNKIADENNYLKCFNKVKDSDVKKEFSEFVTEKVMKLVNDTTDFDTALKNYKKENTQFFGETIVKKVQSSPNLNGGGSKENTTNNIMNDILRSARN